MSVCMHFILQDMLLVFLANSHFCLFLRYSLADMIPEPPYFRQRVSLFLSLILQFKMFRSHIDYSFFHTFILTFHYDMVFSLSGSHSSVANLIFLYSALL